MRNLNTHITAQSTIKEVRIESIEEYTSEGGRGQEELVLCLSRTVLRASLTVYLLSEGPRELGVSGTVEDSMINRASSLQNLGLVLGSVVIGIILEIGLVFGVQYSFYTSGRL